MDQDAIVESEVANVNEAESSFIDGILELVERHLSYDGTYNIPLSRQWGIFDGLSELIEAKIRYQSAATSTEMFEGNAALIRSQIELKKDIAQLRRNINIASGLSNILVIAWKMAAGTNYQHLTKISVLRREVEAATAELKDHMAKAEVIAQEK